MSIAKGRALVTGGAGFIGSAIADQLLAEQVAEAVEVLRRHPHRPSRDSGTGRALLERRVVAVHAAGEEQHLRLLGGEARDVQPVGPVAACGPRGVDVRIILELSCPASTHAEVQARVREWLEERGARELTHAIVQSADGRTSEAALMRFIRPRRSRPAGTRRGEGD